MHGIIDLNILSMLETSMLSYSACWQQRYLLTPCTSPDKSVLSLAYALTKQSFVKQILTEADKVILSRISPIKDQGGYALALNYGSPCLFANAATEELTSCK